MNNLENIKIIKADISNLEDIEKIEQSLTVRNLSYTSLECDLKSNSTIYFVALENDKIVGYVGAEMLYDHIDIIAIAIDANYRKMGIATSLLNEIISICKSKNFDSIFLEVRTSNTPAIKLYEKLGFYKINVRPNYYKTEDAYIYKKGLA